MGSLMKESTKIYSFEWSCIKCNHTHIYSISEIHKDNVIRLICNYCDHIQRIATINIKKHILFKNWLHNRCHMCIERRKCGYDHTKIYSIIKLGFCQEYMYDYKHLKKSV